MRISASQERNETPNDVGAHQRWNSSGFAQASNTVRVEPPMVRLTTSSRSDVRSAVVPGFTARPLMTCVVR